MTYQDGLKHDELMDKVVRTGGDTVELPEFLKRKQAASADETQEESERSTSTEQEKKEAE